MKKTRIVIWILVIILLSISICFTGYGLYLRFSTPVSGGIDIESVSVVGTEGQSGNVGDPIYSNSIFTFSAMLIAPGDSITYKVRFVNNSSKNIVIKDFEKSRPESSFIKIDLKGVKVSDTVYAGDAAELLVKVSYDKNSSTNSVLYTNMTVKIDYDEV